MELNWTFATIVILILVNNSKLGLSQFCFNDIGNTDSRTCERQSQTDNPRLNLRIEPVVSRTTGRCRLRLVAYAQSRTMIDAIRGSYKVEPPPKQNRLTRLWIGLKPLPTGMKSGSFAVDVIPAFLCRGVRLLVMIDSCLGPDGGKVACPQVRVVDASAVDRIQVVNPESTVCFD